MNIQDLIKLEAVKMKLETIFNIKISVNSFGFEVTVPYADMYMKGWDQNNLLCPYTLIDALAFSIKDQNYPVSKQDVVELSSFLDLDQESLLSKIASSIRNEVL